MYTRRASVTTADPNLSNNFMFNPYKGSYRRNSAAPFSLAALVSGPESPKYNTVNFPLHGRASTSALYSVQNVEGDEEEEEDETMLHRMGRKLSLLKLLPRRSHVEKVDTVIHIGMKTEVEIVREEAPRKNSRGASRAQFSLKKGKVFKDDATLSALSSTPSSSLKGKRVARKPAPIWIPPLSNTTHVIHATQPTFVFPADYSVSSASQSPPIQSDDDIIPSLCSEYSPDSTGDMHSHFMIAPSIQMEHTEAIFPPRIPVAQQPALSAPLFSVGPANETRSISPSQLTKNSAKRPQIHRVGAMLRAIFGNDKGRRHAGSFAASLGRRSSNKRKKMNKAHPPSPKRVRQHHLVEDPALSMAYQLHGVHISTSHPLPHYRKQVREIEETSAGSSGVSISMPRPLKKTPTRGSSRTPQSFLPS